MISLSSTAAERIGKLMLMLMLSSIHDGEVVGAARAIDRTLRAENKDWHDLANTLAAPAPPRAHQGNGADHWSSMHWRSAAEFCARPEHDECLNDWERGFANDLVRSRYHELTDKQAACLERIRQRIVRWKQQHDEDAPF